MSDRTGSFGLVASSLLCALAITPAAADELPVRDPTRPPFPVGEEWTSRKPDEGLRLVSTTVSENGRSAVINGEIVAVGSHVGDAVVTAIEQGRVTLKRGTDAIVLQLFTPPVKRPARDSS